MPPKREIRFEEGAQSPRGTGVVVLRKTPVKAPSVETFLPGFRWVYKLQQTRPWLGLVDLSRTPIGTFFFREVNLALEMGYKHRQNRLSRVCVIWPQKHENVFLQKFGVRKRIFFVYHRPQGIVADLT